MKDELEELETDPSTRRAATDWLMQVISAKGPINLHLNGPSQHRPRSTAVDPLDSGESSAPKLTGDITAEDLCGAPAVPVVKASSAADLITADDVCWVPVEMRLKLEPAATEPPPPPAPKILQMGQLQTKDAEPEMKAPEPEPQIAPSAPRAELSVGRTALAAELVMNHESTQEFVSMADISREPAPYVVEPISATYSDGFHQSALLDRPISAVDIAKDWVVESMEPQVDREKDGVVLPFSFKVLKSKDAAEAAQSNAEAQAAPAEIPDSTELTPSSTEAVSGVSTEHGPDTETAASSALEEPASAKQETLESVEVPAASAETLEAQMVDNAQSQQDLLEIKAALETLETATPVETEMQPTRMKSGSLVGESVFAHEGYWAKAQAESGAGIESVRPTPLFRDMEPTRPYPPPDDLSGDSAKRPEGWFSAWKTLLRLGSVLPWIAQALPAIESGALAEQGVQGRAGEMRQDVAGLRLVQYEIRTAVQDHSVQLKRMEDQLERMRESLDSRSSGRGDLAEDIRSMTKLVRLVGISLGSLLAVLAVLVIILLSHGR